MTLKEYRKELARLKQEIIEESSESGRDIVEVLQEMLDGHEFVIYYHSARQVLTVTDNPDAIFNAFGDTVDNKDGMFDSQRAYCAMEQDLLDMGLTEEGNE